MSPKPRQTPAGGIRQYVLLIAGALVATAILASGDRLWRADTWLYDQFLGLSSRYAVSDPRIVIVAIDEYSLEQMGQWPWSRALHAEAIRRLTRAGVRGIAVDFMFAETHGIDPDGDGALAAAIAENGNVVLPVSVAQKRQAGPMVEVFPLPPLTTSAMALGHTDTAQERDGLTRGVFLRAGLGETRWSTLALALLEGPQRKSVAELPGLGRPAGEPISPYQWGRDRYVLLPLGRPSGTFTHISFADLVAGDIPEQLLRDRWVMIGMTASGYGGAVATPGNQGRDGMRGIEFHAYVLKTLLDDSAITPLSRGWRTALACLFVLLPFVLYAFNPLRNAPTAVGLAIALLLATSTALLFGFRIWFAPAAPLAVLAACLPLLLAVHLRRFRYMAIHDPMTGLANRRFLADSFEREWRSAIRSRRPLALLLIDVDGFKAYNDRYGHPQGDDVLRAIGQVIAGVARRPRDLAARSGGEEFALVLPETNLEGARNIAENLRARIVELNIRHADSPHEQRLTASIGGHACVPSEGQSSDLLYDSADRALYRAKNRGRNRVFMYTDG